MFSVRCSHSFFRDVLAFGCGGARDPRKQPQSYLFWTKHGRHHFIWMSGLKSAAHVWMDYDEFNIENGIHKNYLRLIRLRNTPKN